MSSVDGEMLSTVEESSETCTKQVSIETLEDELKLTEEKYNQIIDQVRAKNEELSKLKEHALVLSGARSVLMKICQK